jgi:hypothetical protein
MTELIYRSIPLQQAEALSSVLNQLLQGKRLVRVQVIGDHLSRVERNESFQEATIVDYGNDSASVMISCKGGVVSGIASWIAQPNDRTVHGIEKNGRGEVVRISWTILEEDEDADEKNFQALRKLEAQLRKVRGNL